MRAHIIGWYVYLKPSVWSRDETGETCEAPMSPRQVSRPAFVPLWQRMFVMNHHEYGRVLWGKAQSPRCVHDCNDHNNHNDEDGSDRQHVFLVPHMYASLLDLFGHIP